MNEGFVNKVAESGMVTIDLEKLFPASPIVEFDIQPFLFMNLILKEKDFRQSLKALDVSVYANKIVAVHCSVDAIIPMWAYMLIASMLQPVATQIVKGTEKEVMNKLLIEKIKGIDAEQYIDQRVVVKGCGELPIPEEAYLEITNILRPVAKSIMFGEPCSTVPVFKKAKD
jgi:hypothetical protein